MYGGVLVAALTLAVGQIDLADEKVFPQRQEFIQAVGPVKVKYLHGEYYFRVRFPELAEEQLVRIRVLGERVRVEQFDSSGSEVSKVYLILPNVVYELKRDPIYDKFAIDSKMALDPAMHSFYLYREAWRNGWLPFLPFSMYGGALPWYLFERPEAWMRHQVRNRVVGGRPCVEIVTLENTPKRRVRDVVALWPGGRWVVVQWRRGDPTTDIVDLQYEGDVDGIPLIQSAEWREVVGRRKYKTRWRAEMIDAKFQRPDPKIFSLAEFGIEEEEKEPSPWPSYLLSAAAGAVLGIILFFALNWLFGERPVTSPSHPPAAGKPGEPGNRPGSGQG